MALVFKIQGGGHNTLPVECSHVYDLPLKYVLAKADRRPREKKKFYHHFSIVKYSYLPKDTFKKYVEIHVTRSKLTLKFPGYCTPL